MKYKYQIILLGSLFKNHKDIIDLLYNEIAELRLQKDFYKIIYKDNFEEYSGNQPAFALYFGTEEFIKKDIDLLQKLILDGNTILPIFKCSFSNEIPIILENQNGLRYSEDKNIKIVNLILESFGKLRTSRKVFISYRRDQSTSVAIQLFEALEKNNFDVFLDTHSIKQGEPFQDELWHRMTDSDVIVLLNTSEFLESRWCKEEIAKASTKRIGIIQLVWPNHNLERMAEISFPKQLKPSDFINGVFDSKDISKLNEQLVNEIIEDVESIRSRTLASRQDYLITNFLNVANRLNKKVNLQPERFITEELEENKRRIIIPTVGVPQSTDCEFSSELRKEIKEYSVDEIFLLYDNLSIRDKWLKHLNYLNQHLDVKTLKINEIENIWYPDRVKNIFLSASIPMENRDDMYLDTADIVAIRDAVIALTTKVLPHHKLIWGGHPSITPLIYDVMEKMGLNIQDHVKLYQSKFYEKKFPTDNNKFENVILTENTGEKISSENLMRERMLSENEFAAAVFIGGMEGIKTEYDMFISKHPSALVLPIASTGAATKLIYENDIPDNLKEERFLKDYGYSSLFEKYLLEKI